MKYIYAYKTSDGVRHEAVIEAQSRDLAFVRLRKQGIKPIKVVAADGSKANGEIHGVRKRVVAAVAVVAAGIVGVIAFMAGEHQPETLSHGTEIATPRHQIYGDPVILADFERGNFEGVLTNKADQMLAWFAQPGKLMCPKGVDLRLQAEIFAHSLATPHEARIPPHEARSTRHEAREALELVQIVNGMHEEMREYLANGNGTYRSYWRRLIERTQQEMMIYERTRRELEKEKDPAVWEERNESLRRLGLRTIPNPNEGE